MANTFSLGGSPLGLIGVSSRPTKNGMSSFNGGDSRNINVGSYNLGLDQPTSIKIEGVNIDSNVSLFTGGSIPNFFGNINTNGTDEDTTGVDKVYKGINRSILHSNEVYDTSILNIIEKLSFSPKASLRPQDFAYLKNVGVYPNNRLMIARRFTEPQGDNIMTKSGSIPTAVMITWKPENEDFIDFTYGEFWDEAAADFTGILNKLGENFRVKGMGTGGGNSLNVIPLPGVTELLQRKVLIGLGILNDGDSSGLENTPLPSGNPNIIKEAKKRKTIAFGQSGSGLMANISIKMKIEYEQKFISGIDPTLAWMDILNNALIFGTSNSDNYGLSPKFAANVKSWTSSGGVSRILTSVMESLISAIKSSADMITNLITSAFNTEKKTNEDGTERSIVDDLKGLAKETISDLKDAVIKNIEAMVSKYRIELLGVTHSLSGLPSTPWHITIGNPLRPIFCSGDMLTTDINIKMGSVLAFNDLPSKITVEFTLKNARSLGLQEILAKFNNGHLRVVNTRKDFIVGTSQGTEGGYYNKITRQDVRDNKDNLIKNADALKDPRQLERDDRDDKVRTGVLENDSNKKLDMLKKTTTKENSK